MSTDKQAAGAPRQEGGSSSGADPVGALAEEYLRCYRQGEQPTLAEYLERYPELAEEIRAVFPALIAVERLKPLSSGAGAAGALGSLGRPERVGAYRLVREIGRGGMGVVYEAEHESLGRRVALKVLPVAAAQEAKLLERFRREARAAAQLHHTNIVPVFEVGQDGGVFFYAMQYIQGQPVDSVIQELQRLRAASGEPAASPAGALARSLGTGQYEPARTGNGTVAAGSEADELQTSGGPAASTPAVLPGQSELSIVETDYRLYCHNVARLGLQAAGALAYAHGRGVVHRDIKPSNLLLDTAGVLWVSDFGLVKTQGPALTDTGDIVGTLRYMAPERFQGECDARADVYALGLTLYELLALRPAFDGNDRPHLLEQITRQEPPRLRLLSPRVPRDLETILMKAIEKDPRRRYPSAEALAEDLRRFLADEPVRARRIGPLERLGRWGRRNPLVAGLTAAVVLVAALGFAGVFGQMQVARANERQAHGHAARAERTEREAKKERDEVKALNAKLEAALKELRATQAQLRRTLQAVEKERDEVKGLNDKLRATQDRLRRTLYAAHMNLAKQAWDLGGIERVRELLDRHRPKPGETDLRDFEWYHLDRVCPAALLTIKGGRCVALAYSPDGKRLATGTRVWDAQTGKHLLSFKGGGDRCVAFSPDGKRMASGSSGPWGGPGKLKVWDTQTGKELLNFEGHTGWVERVAFSPDGKLLASASSDKTVRVWDAQIGKGLLTFKGHTGMVTSVAFSPDGKRLASGSFTSAKKTYVVGEVKVWDARTGKELVTLKGHTNGVNSVAFSPDGKRLASGSSGPGIAGEGPGEVKVWDTHTGKELLSFKGVSGMVHSVALSPDGKRLATGDTD
jgi:serine/threonine protein kinase